MLREVVGGVFVEAFDVIGERDSLLVRLAVCADDSQRWMDEYPHVTMPDLHIWAVRTVAGEVEAVSRERRQQTSKAERDWLASLE